MQKNVLKANEKNGTIIKQKKLHTEDHQLDTYQVTYYSEGLHVKGYLVQPVTENQLPGLIYCRGGIGRVGMVPLPLMQKIARLGYVVFAPFYRGSGSGMGKDEFGGDDRYDLYHAITLLQANQNVLVKPISLIGFSRGSIMALLAARDVGQAVGPVVIWGGVTDLLLTYEERIDLRRMLKRVVGHPVKQKDAYLKRSPLEWIEQVKQPILLLHGTADEHVSIHHATKLAARLREAGHPHETCFLEGLPHDLSEQDEEQALHTIHHWIRSVL